jgi:hypothetical protein
MVNTRLQTLLDRCPLSQEDCHNIAVIFSALTPTRQQYILDHWDKYLLEMVMMRKEADAANKALIEETFELMDTLEDAKNAHEADMLLQKFIKQKQTRLELESVQKYEESKKLNLIRSIAQIPNI